MTVLCVVQARMSSSRMPGKVAMDIGGEPMLGKVLRRAGRAQEVDEVVVVTSRQPEDDLVESIAQDYGVVAIRGSLSDVQSRFVAAARAYPEADIMVRVTADCPFIDPHLIDRAVNAYLVGGFDYVSNQPSRDDRRTFPLGLAVEVFGAATLLRIADNPTPAEREHVTPRLYSGDPYTVRVLETERTARHWRWTVDTPEDLMVVRQLDALAGPEPYTWERVLSVAEAHPEIGSLNSRVVQKSAADVADVSGG